MSKQLTRQQLHDLVWDRPMTTLAKEFGLSDVALHKLCRKFRVPTPPVGHWAKKAHGKAVKTTKLPDPDDNAEILIRGSTASNEPFLIAEARLAMVATIEAAAHRAMPSNDLVERTLHILSKVRPSADGLVRCESKDLVRIIVRLESIARASIVLRQLVGAAEQAGLELGKGRSATWLCDGETISFELLEVPDQVEHVATQKELDAVKKWKRDREERHRRYGYWDDWGEPKIPKWEQRYQGRLAIRLEEIRVQSERSPWGDSVIRTFADTRTRDISRLIPRVLTTISAMAAAKKMNREVEARRRAAQDEASRRWAEAERRRLQDRQASQFLDQLLIEHGSAEQLCRLIKQLKSGEAISGRLAGLVHWAEQRLGNLRNELAPATLEERLTKAKLFEP